MKTAREIAEWYAPTAADALERDILRHMELHMERAATASALETLLNMIRVLADHDSPATEDMAFVQEQIATLRKLAD